MPRRRFARAGRPGCACALLGGTAARRAEAPATAGCLGRLPGKLVCLEAVEQRQQRLMAAWNANQARWCAKRSLKKYVITRLATDADSHCIVKSKFAGITQILTVHTSRNPANTDAFLLSLDTVDTSLYEDPIYIRACGTHRRGRDRRRAGAWT